MRYNLYNLFSNIKNGIASKKRYILHDKKNICIGILNVLWDEGFINGYTINEHYCNKLEIYLKYIKNEPCIKIIKAISKPSRRIYINKEKIWKLDSSVCLFILSTSKGVLSLSQCKKLNIGGELICYVL